MSESFDNSHEFVLDSSSVPSDYQQQIKYDLLLNDVLGQTLPKNETNAFIIKDILSTWEDDALTYGGSINGNPFALDNFSVDDLDISGLVEEVSNSIQGDTSGQDISSLLLDSTANIVNQKNNELNPENLGIETNNPEELEKIENSVINSNQANNSSLYAPNKPVKNEDGTYTGGSGKTYDGNLYAHSSRDIDWEKHGIWENTLEDYQKHANNYTHPAYTSMMANQRFWAANPEDNSKMEYRIYNSTGTEYSVPVDRQGNLDTKTYPFAYQKIHKTHGGDQTVKYIDTQTGLEYYANYPMTKDLGGGTDSYYGTKDGKRWSQHDRNWSNNIDDMTNRPGNTWGMIKPSLFGSPEGDVAVFLASLVTAGGLGAATGATSTLGKMGQGIYNYGIRPVIVNEGIAAGTNLAGKEINPLGMVYNTILGAPEEPGEPPEHYAVNQFGAGEGYLPPWMEYDSELSSKYHQLAEIDPENYGYLKDYDHQIRHYGGGEYDYNVAPDFPGIQSKEEMMSILDAYIQQGGN